MMSTLFQMCSHCQYHNLSHRWLYPENNFLNDSGRKRPRKLVRRNRKSVKEWRLNMSVAFWRSCDRVSLMYSIKYNEQGETLYSIRYYCQCLQVCGRFLRPSSGAQVLYTQCLVCARLASMARTRWCVYSSWAPDDGRRNRPKHVVHWQ